MKSKFKPYGLFDITLLSAKNTVTKNTVMDTCQVGWLLKAITVVMTAVLITACEKTPPDYRSEVVLPVYQQGNADKGAILYKEACAQCHQLTPGLNKKGPQLLNVYGAPAAKLADYQYSAALKSSGWVWDAPTLDAYIKDPVAVLPDSKMLSNPIPNPQERADIIAYVSTLRAPVPVQAAKSEQ